MEHWLPFYYETLETLFDYLPGALVSLDHQAEEARAHRLDSIADFYAARETMSGAARGTAPLYRPVKPDRILVGEADWARALAGRAVVHLSPFAMPEEGLPGGYPHLPPPPQAGEGED